jgi:hypothetical protein
MTAAIDQASGWVASLRRAPAIGAPRRQLQPVPDVVVRTRAPGSPATEHVLQQRAVATGIAAYLRQKEIYQQWTATSAAQPVRSVPIGEWVQESGSGRFLDTRM